MERRNAILNINYTRNKVAYKENIMPTERRITTYIFLQKHNGNHTFL